jgi:ribosomal protein S4
LKIGDEITIKETKQNKKLIATVRETMTKTPAPKWLHAVSADLKGKVVAWPEGEDLQTVFDPTLIVELYSR